MVDFKEYPPGHIRLQVVHGFEVSVVYEPKVVGLLLKSKPIDGPAEKFQFGLTPDLAKSLGRLLLDSARELE